MSVRIKTEDECTREMENRIMVTLFLFNSSAMYCAPSSPIRLPVISKSSNVYCKKNNDYDHKRKYAKTDLLCYIVAYSVPKIPLLIIRYNYVPSSVLLSSV